MPTHTESHEPWDLADARGRPMTRDRSLRLLGALSDDSCLLECGHVGHPKHAGGESYRGTVAVARSYLAHLRRWNLPAWHLQAALLADCRRLREGLNKSTDHAARSLSCARRRAR